MKVVIWDWNGTLLDDVDVSIDIGNKILAKRGLPRLEKEWYKQHFVFPTEAFYGSLGFDFEKDSFKKLSREFAVRYLPSTLRLHLHEGTQGTLEKLRQMDLRQLILSASEKHLLRFQVRHFKIRDYFEEILGVDDNLGAGKEEIARRWLAAADVLPDEVVFIGDSTHDKEIADIIGCRCILIPQGHMAKERLAATGAQVCDCIGEVPEMLRRMEGQDR